jgi:hypothetical protein
MKNASRIIINGIAADLNLSTAQIAKDLKAYGVKVRQIEIDHPDPPDLLEKEFECLNEALGDLEYAVQECSGGDYYGDASTPAQLKREVRNIRKQRARIEKALNQFAEAQDKLEQAAAALGVKAS